MKKYDDSGLRDLSPRLGKANAIHSSFSVVYLIHFGLWISTYGRQMDRDNKKFQDDATITDVAAVPLWLVSNGISNPVPSTVIVSWKSPVLSNVIIWTASPACTC